ncbi:D-alanyl-D-alanine carboxypeptidase/D-alanyl-D-alanine-endopeptidase [Comamonas serinivorans]|uniref:D-alanyl-D-alanine carboxypeptidase/D-alanyl-D-alanine-endopeptidase n=1 Tax=Comamonas serinivorans TaxID=1082851 RepID=A0A1Y0EI68_9BURK|nr:D-alanyl-D-alanine carboxypeptidase/D-alanyl-D-alanine-endopeptidase [Comamonas serinivorans]ARU03286.1 D-alanyl-D-alanine carboxypeptidase/D-alanyl-D-alanine-endopeptidase [Comamonas serinivorans]
MLHCPPSARLRALRLALGGLILSTLAGTSLARTAAPVTALPSPVSQALQQAKVPLEALSVIVAPLPPAPGAVNPRPEPVNPSGNANAQPAPWTMPAPRLNWQPDVPRNPASVMKLVTTYAGLDLLGSSYLWRTRVYVDGPIQDGVLNGNLILRGGGDPKLVIERLQDLLAHVMEKGVRVIRGDIILDNSVFTLPAHDPAAFDDEPLRPYNAAPDGLLMNFKSLVFRFVPDGQGQALVYTTPPLAGLAVTPRVPLNRNGCGVWQTGLQADFQDPLNIRFNGSYPAACGEREWAVAYADPAHFSARMVEGVWRQAGGALLGQTRYARVPAGAKVLVTGTSIPLVSVIADINKFSNNVMAQQLFLTLSSAGDARGSFTESRNRLAGWWRQQFGLRPAPKVDNGSGLSRDERITAASLTALLQHAAQGRNASAFMESLSIAGVDGTTARMRARNPNSAALGNARLKTGTLRDVTAIAGYAYGHSGQVYTVVAIINHPNAPAARAALDRVVDWAVRDAS